jgi:hypothetical protein
MPRIARGMTCRVSSEAGRREGFGARAGEIWSAVAEVLGDAHEIAVGVLD